MRSLRKRTLIAGVVAALTAGGSALSLAFSTGAARGASRAERLGRFVAVTQGEGVEQSIGLYSAASGLRIARLGTFGLDFTNNGLAVTPSDGAVYFTLIPHARRESLELVRLDVRSGRRSTVAAGQQPAIDDAGAQLGFMTRGASVEVRDLQTKTRREIDLGHVLGFTIDPLNSELVWLADGRTLVMLPAQPATRDGGSRTPTSHRSSRRCRPTRTRWPIVFIHVPPGRGALTARCRTVGATSGAPAPQPPGATVLADSPTDPSAVWIASFNGSTSTIEQVAPAGPAQPVLNLGHGVLPEAIDRSSQHILYITGHPPALWEATIDGHRLTHRHRLVAHSLAPIAW